MIRAWLARLLLGRPVDVTAQRVVKFLPRNPPVRNDVVLVDGLRCRVTYAKVTYDDPDEPRRWTLRSLRVKDNPK